MRSNNKSNILFKLIVNKKDLAIQYLKLLFNIFELTHSLFKKSRFLDLDQFNLFTNCFERLRKNCVPDFCIVRRLPIIIRDIFDLVRDTFSRFS